MVGVMDKYEVRRFGYDYQVGNGPFRFRALSEADATYLRDALNSLTPEQHLAALKGTEDGV